MHYAILIYQGAADFAARTDPAKSQAFWGSFMPYMKALQDAGIVLSSAGLQPPEMATTINLTNGQNRVQDGPYADTKEQLGGFFVIDVADLDTAMAWAQRCPAGESTVVEVRPAFSRAPQAP